MLDPIETQSLDKFFVEVKKSPKVYQGGLELMKLAQSNQVEVCLSDGTVVGLFCNPGKYEKGAAVSHLANKYQTTSDFLMAPTLDIFTSKLGNLLLESNIRGAFGPITLKIMEEIGYATRINPKIIELEFIQQ